MKILKGLNGYNVAKILIKIQTYFRNPIQAHAEEEFSNAISQPRTDNGRKCADLLINFCNFTMEKANDFIKDLCLALRIEIRKSMEIPNEWILEITVKIIIKTIHSLTTVSHLNPNFGLINWLPNIETLQITSVAEILDYSYENTVIEQHLSDTLGFEYMNINDFSQ